MWLTAYAWWSLSCFSNRALAVSFKFISNMGYGKAKQDIKKHINYNLLLCKITIFVTVCMNYISTQMTEVRYEESRFIFYFLFSFYLFFLMNTCPVVVVEPLSGASIGGTCNDFSLSLFLFFPPNRCIWLW